MKNKKLIIFFLILFITIMVIFSLVINKKEEKTREVSLEPNIEIENSPVANEIVDELEDVQSSEISVTPSPKVETNIEKSSVESTSNCQYYIKVNTQMNTVTIYIKDENGQFSIPVKAMVCSTGENTPKNCKYILGGKRWEWKELFGHVYGQYTTHINLNILFHSVPYLVNKDPSSLEYWEYDKLGTTASAGCIRLTVIDAKWIFDNCLKGSIVEFYSDSNPGPLGKPSAMKISEYTEYRGWDPTDPNLSNIWKNNNINNEDANQPIESPSIPTVVPSIENTPNTEGSILETTLPTDEISTPLSEDENNQLEHFSNSN